MTTHSHDRLSVKFREWREPEVRAVAASVGADVGHLFDVIRSAEFIVDAERRDAVLAILRGHPAVESASLVSLGRAGWSLSDQALPYGFRAGYEWHLARINAYAAWKWTRGGSLPLGHVDTGLAANLPELSGKTVTGWSVLRNSSDITPYTGTSMPFHGNVTGSLLWGSGGVSGDNVFGVAFESNQIVHVQYSKGDNLDTSTDWTAAILWAFAHGARVISASSYFYNDDQAMHDACDYIYANGGAVVVCAGNEAWDLDGTSKLYPAVYDSVISVGGAVPTDEIWGFDWRAKYMAQAFGSAFGSYVDVVAPTSVMASYGTGTAGGYSWWTTGTSVSVPLVAGVAQLMLSVNPALTGAQIKSIICSCVDKPSCDPWMFYGWFPANVGIVDAERCVLMAMSLAPQNAGVVFPYLRAHSQALSVEFYGQGMSSYPVGAAHTVVEDSTPRMDLNGPVGLEIGGYCNGAAVSSVELWMDEAQVYSGPPTSKWTSLYQRTDYRSVIRDVRVVATAAGGQTGTRSYATGVDAVAAKHSATFRNPLAAQVTWGKGGVAILSGARTPTTLITVTGAASIAPVSYPTETSWSVEVTGLASGTTLLTVADGTDTITVPVTVRLRLRNGATSPQLKSSTGTTFTPTPLRVSDGTNWQ